MAVLQPLTDKGEQCAPNETCGEGGSVGAEAGERRPGDLEAAADLAGLAEGQLGGGTQAAFPDDLVDDQAARVATTHLRVHKAPLRWVYPHLPCSPCCVTATAPKTSALHGAQWAVCP